MLNQFSKFLLLFLFLNNAYALNNLPRKCFDFNAHPVTLKLSKNNHKTPKMGPTDADNISPILIKQAKKQANFANYLRVMSLGCGISCQRFVIFNKKTGFFVVVPVEAEVGAKFQLNSDLFIINPLERVDETLFNRPRSFFWDEKLQQLVFMPECSASH